MSTEPSIDAYAAVLARPPSRAWFVVIVLFVCATIAFLGACAVACAQCASEAYAAKACAVSGGTWSGGACEVPQINVQIVPRGPASERSPMSGPGGA